VEIEIETFLATVKDLKLGRGRARVVRHGYGPARNDCDRHRTGGGPRGRRYGTAGGRDGERIRFNSAILPLCAAHQEPGCAVPVLYLRDISTGDFQRR